MTPSDQLLPTLANWSLKDLQELQAALVGLIEALESPPNLDNQESTSLTEAESSHRLPSRQPQKAARGHIEAKYIPRGNKIHGPYLYLRYWQDGKLKSKYLGKPSR